MYSTKEVLKEVGMCNSWITKMSRHFGMKRPPTVMGPGGIVYSDQDLLEIKLWAVAQLMNFNGNKSKQVADLIRKDPDLIKECDRFLKIRNNIKNRIKGIFHG